MKHKKKKKIVTKPCEQITKTKGRELMRAYTCKGMERFALNDNNLFVATYGVEPVKPSKLDKNVAKANTQILNILDNLSCSPRHEFQIAEVELAASFSAEGKFLGIGVGSATQIKIKYIPITEKK